ncbi:YobI family P-loop NTPase [Flavobacterium sp. MAHUQ-51]|uniref:YobI family P-loop NTPase n=1 Tax=Flavobacterium sp. GCM10022190 TaxID=3252639 RepID=UPI003608BE43
MKKKLIKLIDKIIKHLESIRLKYSNDNEENLAYTSLSPIDNGDENGHYSRALLWALKNRKEKDIKNIALTGSYGAGKSSILKTFQKNYKGNDLKFLNISLATFKEEKPEFDENGKEIKVDKTELLRLIETSILEQIFYHEEDNKIPDSRFKKIKSYSVKKLFFISLGYLLFLLAIYNYFYPYFIQSIFKDIAISNNLCDIIHYSGIFIITLGIFFIILKSVRVISAITINKLKIQNAEIGVGENLNKSILNHHIDEILYFFSIRPYNVVIIEDLDRFRETEIFTKLREVNLLLNNSEKTKRKEIVFVYAVRDDMFTDKERTKFFDFIIPVIPVINSSNSSEILLKKKNQFQYELSDNLIEDISFFIDDMRLLHNISNEFYLYSKKLNENLNQDKLFAIITYKNIYPNDFMKLSCNDGDLYTIFSSKAIFIKNSISEVDTKIEEYKDQIKEYESLFISNINDLRLLYVVRIIETLPGFKSFVINNNILSIDEIVETANFEYLKTNNFKYEQIRFNEYFGRTDTRNLTPNSKFSTIENLIDQDKSYSEKEKQLTEIKNGKINSLKNKIQELEKQKQKTRITKIADLLRTGQLPEIELSDNYNKNFLTILLRNGYIAEDYIDYISLFHEESITRSDYQFHISVKNSIKQPFDYKLSKIEKLLLKINPLDFQTEYVLNYDILDYLLYHPNTYVSQLESIFNKLKDESIISIEFIKGYFETSQKLDEFIKILCAKWSNIWGFIESNPDFSEDLKNSIFKSIIEYGDIKNIFAISKQSSFTKLILSDPLFLNITKKHNKLKKVIEELKVSFSKIDFENSSDEMLYFIYKGNYYQLNIEMVASLIKKFGEFNQVEFDNSNYFAIKTSKTDQLIQYIEANIDNYIENVYLKISTNVNEKEEYLISLLNNENIDIDNKKSVISQMETTITKLSTIEDSRLYPILLENNKLFPSWENLLFEYNNQTIEDAEEEKTESEISESSIGFINLIQNAEELSKIKIPKEVNSKNVYGRFWKKLLQMDKIEDQSYYLITKSSPWWYSDLRFEEISDNKIKSLINSNCVNPTIESFNSLKEKSDGLNIYLLEKRKNDYFKIIDQLTFDSDDLKLILKSSLLNNSDKLKILNTCSEETIFTNSNIKLISTILVTDNIFAVSDNVLNYILVNNQIPIKERIRLFVKNSSKYNLSFIESFLTNLGGNYARITDTSSKARIPQDKDNLELLNVLANKRYISSFSEIDSDFRVNHKRK